MCMFLFCEKWLSVLCLDNMQKEDLIKRLRLFATITTVVFVVLVVSLLVQFCFIAYYHTQMKVLQENKVELKKEIDGLKEDLEYYKGEYEKDKNLTGN